MTGKAANHLNLFGASATAHEILPALEIDGYGQDVRAGCGDP